MARDGGFATPPFSPSPRDRTPPRRIFRSERSPPPQEVGLSTPPSSYCSRTWTPTRRSAAVRSPLKNALMSNNFQVVERLLEDDPCLAIMNSRKTGEPPLLLAWHCGCDVHVIRSLLSHGAEVDAVNDQGIRLLSAVAGAARPQDPAAVFSLSARRCSPWIPEDLVGGDDKAHIILAAAYSSLIAPASIDKERSEAVAVCALAFDADPLKRDSSGKTAADYAEASGQSELAHLIRHWDGAAAKAMLTVIAAGNGRRLHATGSAALLSLPGLVNKLVVDMLAPGLRSWWLPTVRN